MSRKHKDRDKHHPKPSPNQPILEELKRIESTDEHIAKDLDILVKESVHDHKQTGFIIRQVATINTNLQGDHSMAINGIVAGAVGIFVESPTPTGALIPAGTIPVWTTSDTTNTSLTPSADGTSVSVAVAAGTTITTFNLSVANQDGSFLTTVAVPVLPAVVTPPAQTGFTINQTS